MLKNTDNIFEASQVFEQLGREVKIFKRIVEPLYKHLGLDFGYMVDFQNGSYYVIHSDLSFLKDFTDNIASQSLLFGKDITSVLDSIYRFVIWPERPNADVAHIFYRNNQWNGISVYKPYPDRTEIYWFCSKIANAEVRDFLISNKALLIRYIYYFDCLRHNIFRSYNELKLFTFKVQNSSRVDAYITQQNSNGANALLDSMKIRWVFLDSPKGQVKLSSKEVVILSLVARGYTAKTIARKVNAAPKTVQNHLENIRSKVSLHSKDEMVDLYYEKFSLGLISSDDSR